MADSGLVASKANAGVILFESTTSFFASLGLPPGVKTFEATGRTLFFQLSSLRWAGQIAKIAREGILDLKFIPIIPTIMLKSTFDLRRKMGPVNHVADLANDPEQREMLERNHPELGHLLRQFEVLQALQNDEIPVPCTEDREGYYGDCHLGYWLSGLQDTRLVRQIIPATSNAQCILDFGGASGRVARHWLNGSLKCNVVLADMNINHIDFVSEHFPTRLRPIKLSSQPQLMLPDNSCDLVMAFSVFTHIDVYETSWLAEIARVLKPSGHAFLTAHTEHTWSLLPNIYVHSVLQQNDHFNRLYPHHLDLPEGKHVFESADDHHDYSCNVFQHSSYIKRQWQRWFHVLDIVPTCHAYQTGVVLQKRNLP